MSNFWDSLGETAKSLGGAVTAPIGVVIDSAKFVATAPFDDDNDSFGDFVNITAGYANNLFDPIFNGQTVTGKAAGKLFEVANHVGREYIKEPITTWDTVMTHSIGGAGEVSDVFDAETWSRAYEVAQGRSPGQAAHVGNLSMLGAELDPLRKRAYRQAHERAPLMSSLHSGTYDFGVTWFLDPLVVAGKGAKAVKMAKDLRKISGRDRAVGVGNVMDTEVAKKIGVGPFAYNSRSSGLKTRTESYLDWIHGKNAEQIRIGTPELDRSPVGRQVAGLLAEADKLTDSATRLNAQKRILRVHYGDMDEVFRVEKDLEDAQYLQDAMENLATGSPLEVQSSALGRYVFDRPEHFAKIEGQLNNIPEVHTWLNKNKEHLAALLDIKAGTDVTARVSRVGKKRLKRAEEKTAPRVLQEKLGRVLEEGTHGALYQKSLLNPPVWLAKKMFVDAPLGSFDALRTSKLQGIVNLHDTNGMATQMDSMMAFGRLSPADRFDLQSRLSVARTETDKMKVLAATEERTMQGMARHYAEKTGQDEIDADFIRDLMRQQGQDRGSMIAALQGRAYSATKMKGVEEANAAKSALDKVDSGAEWRRVDHFDDDGIPIAMPVLETQAANIVPLLDFAQIEKSMGREFSYLSRISKAWKSQRTEMDRLSKLKASGGYVTEKALNGHRSSMDFLTKAAATSMRAWKFSVLFRLGYPIRVLADEHMRIWSQIGALGLYGPSLNEGIRNFGYNRMGRKRDRAKVANDMRLRLKEIDSVLGDEVVQKRRNDTLSEIKSLNRRIGQRKRLLAEGDEFTFEGRRLYHATTADLSAGLKPRREVQAVLGQRYGPGLYSTADDEMAQGYLSSAGEGGRLVRLAPPKGQKTFDLQQEVSAEDAEALAARFDRAADADEFGGHNLRLHAENIRNRRFDESFERTLRDGGEDWGGGPSTPMERPDYTWQQLYENVVRDEMGTTNRIITDYIEEIKGATVLKQRGGQLLKGKKHDVYIWLRPESLKVRNSDEVAEIEAKAEKAREEAAAFEARRSMLQELLDVDPEELQRERQGIVQALDNYKALLPEKRHFGDEGSKPLLGKRWRAELPGGYTIDDAFAGPLGKAARKASSSNESFEMQLQDVAHRNYQSVTGGSWRTIQSTEGGHLDAWQWAANKHLRQSRAAMHFIKGGSIDEFVEWTKSGEGASIAKRVAHFGHDPEQWAHRVKAMVDEYVPTDEMRAALVKGEVTRDWLRRKFPDVNVRPDVHGGSLEANLETGSTSQTLHNWMMGAYRAISDKPTDQLARHPFFAALYRREVDSLKDEYVAAAKRAGRNITSKDAEEITKIARRNALHDVKRFLFDISTHSNAAYTLRFISPFFSAHQESLSRWWRIVSDDPSVTARFVQGFDAPRKAGLVVDREGNPVKPMSEGGPMVSGDHKYLVQVPRAWLSKKNQDKYKLDWEISENSFNIVLQGGLLNPGVGPIVQMPVELALEQAVGNAKELEKLAKTLNPYRPDNWFDPAIPATARRVHSVIAGEKSEEYTNLYFQNLEDRTMAFMEAHGGRSPNQDELDRIMVQAKRKTQTQALLRVASNFLSPAPAHPRSRYEAIRQGWHGILDQMRAEGRPYQWAEDKFFDRYGEAMAFLTESTSNNVAGVDPTQETVAYMKKNRKLLDQIDPRLHGMVVAGVGAGAYSPAASSYLSRTPVRPGDERTYYDKDAPREGLEKSLASQGWEDYSKAMAGLNATAFGWGMKSYMDSDALQEEKRMMVAALAERNPHWYAEYSAFDANSYDRLVNDMRNVAAAKNLRGDTARGDIQALRAYLALRDQMTLLLKQRDQMGGSADMTAESNSDLARVFTQNVSALVESNTWFEQYAYNGTIEHDPYLEMVA